MGSELPKNGHLLRTFEQSGHTISEVEFEIEDLGRGFIGYMVGIDDGRSPLSTTPEEAIARSDASTGGTNG